MTKRTVWIFSIFIIITAIACGGLCVHHYGMGVHPCYKETLDKDISTIMQGTYRLEDGTVIEQLYTNSASYMAGIDLLLLGTGDGCEGTLYVQLCDTEGNVLSQKREELQTIEAGQFYPIRFLDYIDVSDYEKLIIRIYVEDNNSVPEVMTTSSLEGVQDSITCSVNGEQVPDNLIITYLYGKWQYVGYEWKSKGVIEALAASLLLIFLVSFIIIYSIYNVKKADLKAFAAICKKHDNLKQILYILCFFGVFLGASVVFKIRNHQNIPIGICLYIVFAAGITGYYFYLTRQGWQKKKENLFYRMLQDKGLIIVILFSTLIRIPLFKNIQLWDGSIYYGGLQRVCSNFDYTLTYIWDNFRLCGHYAIAYTFFTAIGEFLLPDNCTGVLIITLILTNGALACIYKMFRNYWLKLSQKEAAIGTILISVSPLFLGLFSETSLEPFLVIFTIFLFYAEYKEQKIMKIVWLFSIMNTKETGLIIAGGYLFTHICVHLINTVKYKKNDKVQYFFSDFNVKCAIGAVIFICLYAIKQNGLFPWMNISTGSGSTGYIETTLPVSAFFLQKIKLIFILHFEWIPVLMIIFSFAFSMIKYRKIPSFSGQISFWGTLVFFIMVNFYLIYLGLGRYCMYSAVMIWILAYIMLYKTFGKLLNNRMRFGVSFALIILLVIQNFYFIDPLTNLVFDQFDSGKGKMISTEIDGGNFGDTFTTNFRRTYLYDLIDQMLEESNFDADTSIIVPYEKDYTYFYAYVGYDEKKRRRVFNNSFNNENVIDINNVFLREIVNGDLEEIPERGIMYFLPYIESEEQEYIEKAKEFYVVGERREVDNWGGTLAYYVVEKNSFCF